jgi:hypothetical protein
MTIAQFLAKYGAAGTIFQAGQTRGIGSEDMRELIADIVTLSDIPITGILIDEDDMVSDSAVKAPTQQSVKAYRDARSLHRFAALTGTNTYTGSLTPALTGPELEDGFYFFFTVDNSNTSRTVTVNLNSVGATGMYKYSTANDERFLHIGDLRAGVVYLAIWGEDEAIFRVVGIPEQSFEYGITATSKTLTAISRAYVFTGTSASNWDLPTPSNNSDVMITIKNRGTQDITLDSASGSQIYGGAAQASLTIGPGEAYTLLCDGQFFNIL